MMGAPSGVGIGRTHSNAATASDRMNPTAPGMGVNPSSASTDVDACQVYLSLIQQYLSVFQVDNALWLAERCLADYPRCYEAVYMQALCYYRMGKIKNCHACLNRHQYNMTSSNSSTTTYSSNACGQNTSNSMIFLSALCSMELGDYSSAETILLQGTRIVYKQQQTRDSVGVSMDDWILQSTPCPVPNGAAGLALLGKIFRKTNRKERALQYFRMSLQLDPFLFTSFQALAELGDTTLDASDFFGGTVLNDRTNQFLNTSNFPQSTSFRATDGAPTAMPVKTPLQPMMSTPMLPSTHSTIPRMGTRAIGFETPDLTPITRNNNDTFGALNHPRASMTPMTSVGSAHGPPPPMESNQAVFRRAKHVAGRQYYPPSPDTSLSTAATPVTSVTRSMRYLRGLGTGQDGNNVRSGRSLFPSSLSENQAFNQGPSGMATSNSNNNQTIAGGEGASLKPEKTNDAAVQEILDILTISGAAYHHLCQYRCREALQLLQQLPSSQQLTPWVLHQEGRAFLEQGDFFSAQRCFEFMQSVDPGRMQGLELLSTVYWQLKKEIDLANLAQRAMDWDFLSPQAHCVAGNCFSLQKDHETALVFFKRSLQLDPTFTYTHTLSGYEYMANEDFGKATSCFRKALQTDDRHYNAWYGLGMIYYRQEKYDLAEYHFERAVSIHPTSGVLRCNLGMAQNANGKAYVALETLSEAFRLDPRNPQARFQRATIYSALHRHEEAFKELTIVRDAAPREATVHFAMGKILKRLGRLDEAMKCFLTAMDLDPKDNQLIKSAMDKLGEPEGDEESTTNY